jgi:hypothetical protein
MAGRVYKLFLARWTANWYDLSPDEQTALITQVDAALERVGAKRIVLGNSSWTNEQWPFFGVEEFPSVEALQEHSAILQSLKLDRYSESMSVVGTPWEDA